MSGKVPDWNSWKRTIIAVPAGPERAMARAAVVIRPAKRKRRIQRGLKRKPANAQRKRPAANIELPTVW
jgi:hypothetical protein